MRGACGLRPEGRGAVLLTFRSPAAFSSPRFPESRNEEEVMKKLLATLALTSAACAAPALAGDVGVSISIGEPGFYGQLDIGNAYRPRVIYSEPVVIERRYRNVAPIYVRVPVEHSRHWSRYCGRYNACARPVYFVRDDWYREVYVPRYRQQHYGRDYRYDRRDDWRDRRDHRDNGRDDRRDDRRDWRNDRNDHDHDHDRRNYRD
jgi:hypothetical protein